MHTFTQRMFLSSNTRSTANKRGFNNRQSLEEQPRPDSAPKTYPTLATFAWTLIKIYSVRYYIIHSMRCINYFPQFLPLPTVIPLENVLTTDNFLIACPV